ncbi:Cytochrome P450, partial [Operophtera brumata]
MIFALILFIFVVTVYLYSTRTFDYWKKRGIKHDTPIPIFGTNAKGYLMQRSMSELAADMYWKYPKEKVVGFFRSSTPELIIRDPDIVKRVLLTDFSYFYKRQVSPILGSDEPLLKNLFNVDGDLWRLLRQRMTPAFTSGKLKAMFPLIVERAERLQVLLSSSHGKTVDAREVMARYTTDFIGACGFGLEANSLNKEDSEIRILGQKIFKVTYKGAFKAMAKQVFPQLCKNVRLTDRFESDLMGM